MKPHRPYKLEKYNPNWPREFEKRAEIIRSVLGGEIVNIEHIGSTSIPGMIAKPQIDILVIVEDLNKIKNYYNSMRKVGFISKGDYIGKNEEYFIEDNERGERLASIHLFQKDNSHIVGILNFRDYLRENKKDRDLYISVKKDLYQKHSNNYHDYDIGKKETILAIKKRADNWSRRAK